MGFIYKIVNKANGMIYIGQTIKSLQERWRQHRTKSSNCRYLKHAFKKYGIDNFDFIMICICFDEDLDKFEIQYMKSLNSMVPNGYNLREGGNSGRHSEETKKKISDTLKSRTDLVRHTPSFKGIYHTDDSKKKISDTLKSRTDLVRPSFKGIYHTDDSKKKMSESHKIKINQYDLNDNFIKLFDSISDAAKETNIERSSIGKCCNRSYKTSGGFKWKFSV